MSLDQTTYTVSDLTELISEYLTTVPAFRNIWVEGELSNFRRPSSGHLYFTLKDAGAQISCVMFRSRASGLRFPPSDGDQVRVHGSLSVYKRSGQYQLNADRMVAAGTGVLQQAFERLKLALEQEGLFEAEHKRALPLFPQRIGVVTSSTGAAIRDILNILNRRYPNVEILLYPVLVQGEGAAPQISQAIRSFNAWNNVDVLIVGRGGGSLEDLWAFNEEIVARSIFASHIPVISAVGHETDFTLADYVADQRAPTPSAAAEVVVPNRYELLHRLQSVQQQLASQVAYHLDRAESRHQQLRQQLKACSKLEDIRQLCQHVDGLQLRAERATQNSLSREKQNLVLAQTRLEHHSPLAAIQEAQTQAKHSRARLQSLALTTVSEERVRLEKAQLRLETLDPLKILQRGYGFCSDDSGSPITSTHQLDLGDIVQIELAQGRLLCHIFQIHEDKTHGTEL